MEEKKVYNLSELSDWVQDIVRYSDPEYMKRKQERELAEINEILKPKFDEIDAKCKADIDEAIKKLFASC